MSELDHQVFLRRAFDVARRARRNGNHPFGAILIGPTGEVLMEVENGFMPDHDMTGHAERPASNSSADPEANAAADSQTYSVHS